MGALSLPSGGLVYLDTDAVIYSVVTNDPGYRRIAALPLVILNDLFDDAATPAPERGV
ncbi:hypothetical protein EYB53_012140 [Candidatus Chloroploca sp. M-50]|uniref:Uncharacterized protein n=1 Tax=Candidatus Chloroploca mongolica TaxID=2528176 RepID=A0ABS4DAH9_9CHLR|nr:hypothetical protein [Candidatus Chloroploca mongolica]MBP1466455.1 hypothetical protein [Candidatus Chloroploca mongolica]